MSNISGVKKRGLDPKVSLLIVLIAFAFLVVSVLSIGAVAVLLIGTHSQEDSSVQYHDLTTTTTKRTTTLASTTVLSTTTKITTTTLAEGPTTTFLEYKGAPPTTLAAVVVENKDDCNSTYHGPFSSCGAKNVAWFDQWS